MITLKDIIDANRRIKGHVHETELFHSASLSEIVRSDVYLKCENRQKTGSFKVRGAFNFILSLTEEQRKAGVVCYSNGNHAQAVSYAASTLGVESWVVMPVNATPSKIAASKAYGGNVVLIGTSAAETYPKAIEIMNEKGLAYIDPCEDEKIMAGQGTCAIEMLDTLPDVDTVFVQVGGGGLISGVATAIKERSPNTRVIGVEPERMNCMTASFRAGKITTIERLTSIADGLSGAAPGPIAFATTSKYVDEMITVSEEQIAKSTLLIMQRTKMFIEPSSAATFAGLLSGQVPAGKKNICLLSGGNANIKILAELFSTLTE